MSRQHRFLIILCLVLFALLPSAMPRFTGAVSAAPTVPVQSAAPVVAAPRAPCSVAELDTLRTALNAARRGWVSSLTPDSFTAFQTARQAYFKYASRCAKKLNLNLPELLRGITAYDAPAKAGGKAGNSGGYVPRSANAPTYVPPVAPTVSYTGGGKNSTEAATVSGILFDGSPGTAAPPAMLGQYPVTPFADDPRAEDVDVTGVNAPFGGALGFSAAVSHLEAGSGWSNWSHSYTGDVYATLNDNLTLYMPPQTAAFYFYAEGNDLETVDFTATANDGTSSYPVSITSPSGAKYFGFYAPKGKFITSISVSCPDCESGFAVGEFGIYQNSGADLRVTKFSEPHNVVLAGSIFTYTIYVDNYGPDIANQVVISDTLLSSSNVSIQSCAFSVSQGGGAITQFTCTTGNLVSTQFGTDIGTFATNFLEPLSPNSQGRLRASFRLTALDTVDVTNTTRVSSVTYDPDLSNNFATNMLTVTPVVNVVENAAFAAETQTNGLPGLVLDTLPLPAFPDPACCGVGGTTVTAGRRIRWAATVLNNGPSVAHNVRVQVALPYGTSIIENTLLANPTGSLDGRCVTEPAGAQRTLATCVYDSLTISPTATLQLQMLVDPAMLPGTQLSIDTTVRADEFESAPSDNIVSLQFSSNAWADLGIVKSANGDAITDGTFYYQYDITNAGPSWSRDVTLRDDLPDEVDFVNAFIDPEGDGDANPLQCTVQAGNLLCPLGDLTPTGTEPIRVFVNVHVKADTLDGANITNTADFIMDTPDPLLTNNSDTVILPVASQDLVLTKTAPAIAGAGEYITYNLAVNNDGPLQANTVQVMDYLPAQLKLLTATPDQGSCIAGVEGDPLRPLVCDLGTLAPNSLVNISVEGQVRSDVFGDVLLFNDAQVTGDVPEATLTNNIDSVTTAVEATCGVLPNKPVALSPADGASSKQASRLLDWTDVNCAIKYGVMIRQDSIVAPNFFKTKKLAVSQYTTEKYPRGHDYYWRGLACNGKGCKRTEWFRYTVELVP